MEQEYIVVNYQNPKTNKGTKILKKLKSWTKKAILRQSDKIIEPLMLRNRPQQQQLSNRNSISSSIYSNYYRQESEFHGGKMKQSKSSRFRTRKNSSKRQSIIPSMPISSSSDDTTERTIPLSRPLSQVSRLPRPLSQISQITSRSNNIVSPLPLPTVIEENNMKNSQLDDIQIACRLYEVLSYHEKHHEKRDVVSERSIILNLENNSFNEEKSHSIYSEERNNSIHTEENSKEKIDSIHTEDKRNSVYIPGKESTIMLECEFCHIQSLYQNNIYMTRTSNLSRISLPTSDIYSYIPTVEATQMTVLCEQDQDYIIVKRMFFTDIPRAEIKGIIRLDMPTKLVKAHDKYKQRIAKKTGLKIEYITHAMFHGTTSSFDCNPERFLQGNGELCKKGCGVCGIVRQGNKKKFSKHSKSM
ncbi:6219_t:CDS:1 [Cetraspora pellucida]|uniref:6219_t:CDS:1 n=1 Tax=Cetraspora pellucida TaxID=1433469 RepID=A0ACA9K8Z9_9GLOM|nr:6219_t:CDS:1 [Cetraspora pellucida]